MIMNESSVIVDVICNAPVNKVWQAISDKNKMKEWYFHVSDFKTEPGFEFRFTGGRPDKLYVHLCKVMQVIPQTELSYTWRFQGIPGNSLLTFELFPKGENTRVKVTHSGLETFPPDPDLAIENFRQGWNQIIRSNLKNFVEK
jgi:uncharacterized protein YndB with AHSA1/START domain